MKQTKHTIVVNCPRGLEETLIEEIFKITQKKAMASRGIISLEGTWKDIYLLNLYSRIASRILLKIKEETVQDRKTLYELIFSIPWHQWFDSNKTIRVNSEGKVNWSNRMDFLSLVIKDAVCDSFIQNNQKRPNVDKNKPDIRITSFHQDKKAIIYLDTSGNALFKRFWRTNTGDAPIKENLAAGILALAGYNGHQPFLDPMCGSGTIAIEAASIASNRPPGLTRSFSFQNFNFFDQELWTNIKKEAEQNLTSPKFPIWASDISQSSINNAITNAKNAQLKDYITFFHRPFKEWARPDEQGILISNPPYGTRMSETELIRLQYPIWSKVLKQEFHQWTVGFISSDLSFHKILRLSPKRKYPLFNGKLECRLFLFDIIQGSNRKEKIVNHQVDFDPQ